MHTHIVHCRCFGISALLLRGISLLVLQYIGKNLCSDHFTTLNGILLFRNWSCRCSAVELSSWLYPVYQHSAHAKRDPAHTQAEHNAGHKEPGYVRRLLAFNFACWSLHWMCAKVTRLESSLYSLFCLDGSGLILLQLCLKNLSATYPKISEHFVLQH